MTITNNYNLLFILFDIDTYVFCQVIKIQIYSKKCLKKLPQATSVKKRKKNMCTNETKKSQRPGEIQKKNLTEKSKKKN